VLVQFGVLAGVGSVLGKP